MARRNLANSEEVKKLLRSLGFTQYQALAYITLLKEGPQNYKSLTHLSTIPTGKIYTVMTKLARAGWIQISMNERPMMYHAVDPEIAMSIRINEMRTELDHLEGKAKKLASVLKPIFDRTSIYHPPSNENILFKKIVKASS